MFDFFLKPPSEYFRPPFFFNDRYSPNSLTITQSNKKKRTKIKQKTNDNTNESGKTGEQMAGVVLDALKHFNVVDPTWCCDSDFPVQVERVFKILESSLEIGRLT